MSAGATERLSRLLAMVPYLLSRPGIPVREAARQFGVSERQLVKDLELLFVCGLPGGLPDDLIEAEWDTGYVYVGNADTIARPLRLGVDEALALIVGLRTLSEAPGLHDRAAINRAIAKLEAAAGDAAAASGHVAVDVQHSDSALATCKDALIQGRRLHMRYFVPTRDETTERDVDPMRVLLAEGRWYLEGWCRRAAAVRLFRLDRIVELTLLDAAAQLPPQAVSRDLGDSLYTPSPDDTLVTLDLEPAAAWVADYYPNESVAEIGAGRLRVLLRTADTRWVRRLALRLGGSGHVIDPPQLADEVCAEAAAALAAYS
jgi:predicted DNA-binding transcriptional regulator YafY